MMKLIKEDNITNAERVRLGRAARSGELRIGHNAPYHSYKTQAERDKAQVEKMVIKYNDWRLHNHLKQKEVEKD